MAVLELWSQHGRDLAMLEGDRLNIGKSATCDVVIATDPSVSRVHACFELAGGHWSIHDLGSTNGTFLNGDRLFGERILRDGDEILLGRTRVVFRDRAAAHEPSTEPRNRAPRLTDRERDVLVELCRPLLCGNAFTPPASVREIAEALYVTQAAVKQHVGHLYDKFGIPETVRERRVELANEALQRGAVQLGDLTEPSL